MSKHKWPKLSVVLPVYNEEKNLKRLIKSLKKLSYPRSRLEYLFVDDASTDRSLKMAKEFGMKVIKVATHDIELNKGIGMHAATGEFVYWLDADMEVMSRDYFEKLVFPLMKNKQLIGSFTKEFSLGGPYVKNSLLRFISYDDLQRDPLYQFFSTDIKNTIIQKTGDYFFCKFYPGKCPPVGRILYRRKKLLSTKVGKIKPYIDLETTEIVTLAGFNQFAFVPAAKIRHYHAESLRGLIKKRLRNQELDYIPNFDKKHFTWINFNDKAELFRVAGWIIWANLFVPELVRGVYKMIKNKDSAFLWQPIASIATTDAILWGFLSKPLGRKLVRKVISKLFD